MFKVRVCFLQQAHAYLYASIFESYEFEPPENWWQREAERHDFDMDETMQPYIAFEINLKTLVSCMAVFESRQHPMGGLSTARASTDSKDLRLELVYERVGEPLCLRMHDGRLETSFRLRTLDSPLSFEMEFSPTETTAQVIMRSDQLTPAFQELHTSGDAVMQLAFHPTQSTSSGSLHLSTEGNYGTTEIEYPQDPSVTEKFQCTHTVSHAYPMESIGYMLPALRHSAKTSIRTDDAGMLSVQFMVTNERTMARPTSVSSSGNAFVDFLCCPLDSRP